jgi:zinc protease
VQAWPDRIAKVTVEDVKRVARKYLVDKDSVTGILEPLPEYTSGIDRPEAHAPNPGKS